MDEEKAKGRVGKDHTACIVAFQTLVFDPTSGGLIASHPLITTQIDMCARCGLFYGISATRSETKVDMKMAQPSNGHGGRG